MLPFIQALIPIVLLISIGYVLKRIQFVTTEVWSGIEKLTYYVMFPALLIHTLGQQHIQGTPWQLMMGVIFLVLFLSAVILIIGFRFSTFSPATFTSIFQGGIRFNTYIALSVSGAFFGDSGLALASISAGFMIVFINLLCVGVFAVYGTKFKPSFPIYSL